jgi:hypothetical protein
VAYKASDGQRRKGEGGGPSAAMWWEEWGEGGSRCRARRRGPQAGDQDPPAAGTSGMAAPGVR